MEETYSAQIMIAGLAFLGMSVFLLCCCASYLLCRRHGSSGVYWLSISSVLLSFGFALESVSWAILSKGGGYLSVVDQPQWDILDTIGDFAHGINLAGLVVLPISLYFLMRNLQWRFQIVSE